MPISNLKTELKETTDVSQQNPEVMKRMTELIERATTRLGNDAHQGSDQRQANTIESCAPTVLVDLTE